MGLGFSPQPITSLPFIGPCKPAESRLMCMCVCVCVRARAVHLAVKAAESRPVQHTSKPSPAHEARTGLV